MRSWPRLSQWHLLAGIGLLAIVLTGCTGRDIIGSARGWTPVTVSDGIVYTATRDGDVLALDSQALDRDEDAGHVWKYDPPKDRELGAVFGPPAVGEKFIFIGSSTNDGDTGKLIALRKDRESSRRIEEDEWEKVILGAIIGGPTLAQGMVLVGSEDGKLYAFDAENGERIWTFATEGLKRGKGKEKRIWSTPTVADGVVYFGAMDDYLYAVSLDDGSELWKFKTDGTVITTPLVVGTKVIFGSFDRKLYALDAGDNGRLLWSFKADNWFWAGPISDGEMVYAANMDGKVYALPLDRQDDDAPEWVQDLEDIISSTPVLIGDRLVVATEGGIVSLLDTANGTVEEIPIELANDVRAPLSSKGPDGPARFYVGDRNGVVISIDVERWRISWTVRTRE